MQELHSAKKFKAPSPVKDAASLNSLLGFLNNPLISGATPPPKEPVAAAITETPTVVQPTPPPPVSPPTAAPASIANLNRVFLTGRLKSGKDFIAEQAGCKIFAVADPLYFLVEYFFGKQDKDISRTFLQTIGQWGRGTVSAAYPLTPERAVFVRSIQAITAPAASALCVDWQSYGRNENIWLDALVARVNSEPTGTRVAVSGVRFQNEHARLTSEGFVGFHCMCSPATWAARLKQVGLTPESPAAKDVSEYLAASLDASVTKTLSQQRQGNKLRCVWSDGEVLPPSRRLLTVSEFCSFFPK